MSRRHIRAALFMAVLLCLLALQASTPLPDIPPTAPLDAMVSLDETAETTAAFARDLTAYLPDSRATLNQGAVTLLDN
ncbi:MAG TPA: hypothetical protein VFS21_02900 [Roseiflexaceae bacterium]|nr:hypothetical protein [Roseiflexaceae bacterium]